MFLLLLRRLAAPAALLTAFFMNAPLLHAQGTSFTVSPTGKDSNPGTPEKPFASLEAARGAIRNLKKAGSLPPGGVTVWVRGGQYSLSRTFLLEADDSGTSESPVLYRAFEGEHPRLSNSITVPASRFSPIKDKKKLARLPETAREKVLQLDIASLDVKNAKEFPNVFKGDGGLFELIFDNQRMQLAKWPNVGYSNMKEVLDNGNEKKPNVHGGVFVYSGDRPERWKKALDSGLWLTGFWRVPWVTQTVRVKSINSEKKTITFSDAVPGGIGSKYSQMVNGVRKGDGKEPWFAVNLLEELDQPGEWCVDFKAKKLYFWPPTDIAKATVQLADSDEPVVLFKKASHVILQGLTIENVKGVPVIIDGGTGNLLAGCIVRNTSGAGAKILSGTGNGIQSCDFYHMGAECVIMDGGDRKTLTPAGNFADNNHLFQYGEKNKNVNAIEISGVGNRAAHNLIHDGSYGGIQYRGNNHLMEFNELHNLGLDGGDLGAFYSNSDWAGRGNMIRHNFFHHSYNGNGAYMDDGHCGDTIFGNVVYQAGSGPFLGGGHDNKVFNNLMIECYKGIHFDDRGVARKYNRSSKTHFNFVQQIDLAKAPWSTSYPDLVQMMTLSDAELETPTGVKITGNAMVSCKKAIDLSGKKEHFAKNTIEGNAEFSADPGFMNAKAMDFRLKPDSEILKKLPDFKPIPFEEIGIKLDKFRAKLPSAEETGRNEHHPSRLVFDSNIDMEQSNKLAKQKK